VNLSIDIARVTRKILKSFDISIKVSCDSQFEWVGWKWWEDSLPSPCMWDVCVCVCDCVRMKEKCEKDSFNQNSKDFFSTKSKARGMSSNLCAAENGQKQN
jgi:hypothetical protein